MPAGKFRSITVSEDVYEKLKEMAEERNTSISKLIGCIVSGQLMNAAADAVKEFKKELESVLYDIVKAAVREALKTELANLLRKPKKCQIKEAFLGLREPIKLKDDITIAKGQIVVESEPKVDLSEYKAKAMMVTTDDDATLTTIVPDLGFARIDELPQNQLEEWFDAHGSRLLKILQNSY